MCALCLMLHKYAAGLRSPLQRIPFRAATGKSTLISMGHTHVCILIVSTPIKRKRKTRRDNAKSTIGLEIQQSTCSITTKVVVSVNIDVLKKCTRPRGFFVDDSCEYNASLKRRNSVLFFP
uniref:Secreted protein n=1 Tax=Trichogramma kaykai TaxID=54128 RepID=A0ABD2VZY4_9HYME